MAETTKFRKLNGDFQIYFVGFNYNVFPLERDWDYKKIENNGETKTTFKNPRLERHMAK